MSNLLKIENQKNQMEYLKSIAKIAYQSKNYKDMDEYCLLNLMLTAQDLGISPLKAINGGFYIVKGKVCMSTSLMADRIRKDGHRIKILEMTREKCVIKAIRKDNGDSLKYEYTWEDATIAGLTFSDTWKKYPKIMLYNRCMSVLARILFSDVVGNSYCEEEKYEIQGIDIKDRPIEDPEQDFTIEIKSTNEFISEKQKNEIYDLISNDEEASNIIKKRLSIDSLDEIKIEKFNSVFNWLKQRSEEERNNVKSRAVATA